MAQRDPPVKQQDRLPVRTSRSPGRRAYNQRLLSTRHQMIVNDPMLGVAEASRLALKAVGHYQPSQAVPIQQNEAIATAKTEQTAHQASARKGLMGPMTEITNTQDAAHLAEILDTRLAKAESGLSAMRLSVSRHNASQTKDQLAQDSACTQPPQQSSKANLLQPQLQPSSPTPQQANRPEEQLAEQLAVESNGTKGNSEDTWSAQLQAASSTLGRQHSTSLQTAKEEMGRALRYLGATEQTLWGLKQQTEAIKGSPGLEWYLLREQRDIQTDIEAECARIATLACVITRLEGGTQPDLKQP